MGRLVSDNLSPAVSFVVDETTAESAAGGAPKLTIDTGSQSTRLAVGCKLSGAMVPREETAIAAVVSLNGTDKLEFTDTYSTDQTGSMVTKDVTCVQGANSFMSAADTTLSTNTWISIPACGIGSGGSATSTPIGNFDVFTTASASSTVKLYVL